jgi:hypothetical protein
MTKDEALKLALELLELHNTQYPDRVKGYFLDVITAIKEALAQPEQKSVAMADYMALTDKYVALKAAQRTWVGLTPACPKGLTEYECEVEGVDLVCFLEYTPEEEGSRDSYGLLNEPGTSENLELVNAYVKGTDVDIGHLLLQYLVDHITTTALEDFKNDDL